MITESGGIPIPSPTGLKLPVIVAEKGSHWAQLRVSGTPGHGSQPYKTDNALVTAAAVVQRLAEYEPRTQIHDIWRRFLEGMDYPAELVDPLLDPDGFGDACDALPVGMARQFHACTHTTFAPTIAHGGTKINVIPDRVDLQIDIRTLPGRRCRRGARHARRSARRPGREGRAGGVASTTRRPPRRSTRRCGTRSAASPRRSTRARRSCRS